MIFKRFSTFCLFLILILFQLKSQDLVYKGTDLRFSHSPKDFILQLSPNYVYREDAFPRIVGNINMQYFITRNVSVNGNLSLGQDYAHFGPGLLGIPLLSIGGFGKLYTDEYILLFIVIIGSFENISFYFPVGSNLDISPYFSLLRFQYLYEQGASEINDFNLSLAIGSRLNVYLTDHWMISPYFEYTCTYGSGLDGFQGGVYVGYYFRSRVSRVTE